MNRKSHKCYSSNGGMDFTLRSIVAEVPVNTAPERELYENIFSASTASVTQLFGGTGKPEAAQKRGIVK